MNRLKRFRIGFMLMGVLSVALGMSACGLENVERANLKFITGVKAAREVTTSQFNNGKLSKEAYSKRIDGFDRVYKANDKFAELFVKYGEINPANKQEFLDGAQATIDTLAGLVADGTLGVKNDASQKKFIDGLKVAYAVASSVKVAIAAVNKPVDVSLVEVKKM